MDVGNLVHLYLDCLKAEGKSPYTVAWYRNGLRQFSAWLALGEHPDDPNRWTTALLRANVVHCQERPARGGGRLSPTAVSTLVRALKGFCTWLKDEGYVRADPFARLRVPPAPKLIKPTLSPAEAVAAIKGARQGSRQPLRDEALLLFLLDTGARASEVVGLKARDVDWESRIAKLYGKGAKERYVPFSTDTAKAMQRYALRERKDGSEFFFQNQRGQGLTRWGLTQVCHRLSQRTGVHVAPHKCRHTFAIGFLRNGGSVFALQKMLGHTSLEMTLRYSALVTDDLVNEHRDHSPVAALFARRRP